MGEDYSLPDYYILDDYHNPIVVPMMEWAENFEAGDTRRVAEDSFGDIKISTVFLGLDHRIGPGPPLLFETMIFGGSENDYQERYSTWDEAIEGHARAMRLVNLSYEELADRKEDHDLSNR